MSISPAIRARTCADRRAVVAREHLHELDPAARDPREEELGGSHRLARAAVVHRAVGDEVLVAARPEDAAEDVRRTGVDLVAADRRSRPGVSGASTPGSTVAGEPAARPRAPGTPAPDRGRGARRRARRRARALRAPRRGARARPRARTPCAPARRRTGRAPRERGARKHGAVRDRAHRHVGDDRLPVTRRDRDRERVRAGERRAAIRVRQSARRRRGQRRDEAAVGEPSRPVAEHAGREAAARDDDARALGRIGERGAHDLLEHEVAERSVAVPALEALLRLDQQRPSGRIEVERLEPRDAREVRATVFPWRSAYSKCASRASTAGGASPSAASRAACLVRGHRVAKARSAEAPHRPAPSAATRRSSRSGLTATGWPTASRNGTSEWESEYAVELARSSPSVARELARARPPSPWP